MNPNVLSPSPVRPHKRPFSNIDPECVPASKHHRPHPPNPPPTDGQPSQVPRSTSAPPWPSSLKPALRNLDPLCAPASKHRLHSLTDSPVDAWLSKNSSPKLHSRSPQSSRPTSCAAAIDSCKYAPAPLEIIKQMSQQQYGQSVETGSVASQSKRPGTGHSLYRGSLLYNYVSMDYSGRKMPEELREFATNQILKQRKSPQLEDNAVSKVIETAEELADSSEGPTSKLMRTPMFPLDRYGIGEGGNAQWNTDALPNNPEYEYDLSAPKPDVYLGYSNNQRSSWSYGQSNAINHPVARPYTQPARGNTFPFFMIEMKSEAAGGTLYVAENQAAGSGSHSVNALLWLLKEAGLSDSYSVEDKVAFTVTMSHREAIFYVHWYSADDRRFYMSYLKSYSSMEPEDIRRCSNTVKNIIDHAVGARKTMIGNALQALFPFPEHWKQSRPASTVPSTSDTSFTEDMRPSKNQRRR